MVPICFDHILYCQSIGYDPGPINVPHGYCPPWSACRPTARLQVFDNLEAPPAKG